MYFDVNTMSKMIPLLSQYNTITSGLDNKFLDTSKILSDVQEFFTKIIVQMKELLLSINKEIILEKQEEGGYTVYIKNLPGCISEGDTQEDALKNIEEAKKLYLETLLET